MNEAERAVGAVAAAQYGVATLAQAIRWGMRRRTVERRVHTGAWEELFHQVYRLPGAPKTGRQRAFAATLWAGADGLVSHTTAARLLRLDGVRAPGLHLTVPRHVGLRTSNAVLHRTDSPPLRDRATVDGIPCTSATRTIIDSAALLDAEALEVAFESARRHRLTNPDVLARRASELCGRGRPGSRAIRCLLEHQRPGDPALQFQLEVKMARLLRESRLPVPIRQLPVGPYFIDFAFADLFVGVECEGFEFHGSRLAWKRDKRRTAVIEQLGWRLVFVTWDDVTKYPAETLDRIALALHMT